MYFSKMQWKQFSRSISLKWEEAALIIRRKGEWRVERLGSADEELQRPVQVGDNVLSEKDEGKKKEEKGRIGGDK